MNVMSASDLDDQDLQQTLLVERLKLYYDAYKQSVFANLINSVLLVFLLWGVVDHSYLIGWLLLNLANTLYRALIWLRFRKIEEDRLTERQWYWHMLVGSILSGLLWGGAGYLFFTPDLFYQALLGFILAGMTAGAVVTLAPFFESTFGFVVCAITPFLIRLLESGTTQAIEMSVMVALFLVLISVSGNRVHQTIVEGLRMRFLREKAESLVYQQAYYDELTELPNRRTLRAHLEQELSRAQRHDLFGAVLFLDLDHFKRVNDTRGHGFGDRLLVEVAVRLRANLRKEDMAARLGGDEFVILLSGLRGKVDDVVSIVRGTAEKIRAVLEVPFQIEEHLVHISSSIGVALFPTDSSDADELLKHADTAMYRAKEWGRNSAHFFLKDMQERLERRIYLENALRSAIEKQEFELYVQPLSQADGQVAGGEVLLRWFREEGESVSPAEFIPIAEDSGLILGIGEWILDQTCQYLTELTRVGLVNEITHLAVNISPRELLDSKFVERVETLVHKYDINPGLIQLEVTENVLVDNFEDTVRKMDRLRDLGIKFAIDDFGTGYSSLSYLKQLPLDTLKIDRSFVAEVTSDKSSATIVKTIMAMADMMSLITVAEGVEDEKTLKFLEAQGCELFQGYYFAKPMPFKEFIEFLGSGNSTSIRAGIG